MVTVAMLAGPLYVNPCWLIGETDDPTPVISCSKKDQER